MYQYLQYIYRQLLSELTLKTKTTMLKVH